jgi:hypothetical protein
MSLPLPRSLFARLMLIWLVGMTLVLAVSLALFLGERERIGRSALFEGVAQEIASVAELLDRMSPPERERWIDEIGRRRLRLALRPPHDHLRPLADDHPLQTALREAMPQRPATLYTHPRDDRPHPGLAIVLALADGTPLQVRLPGIPPLPPIMPHQRGPFLAALAALVLGSACSPGSRCASPPGRCRAWRRPRARSARTRRAHPWTRAAPPRSPRPPPPSTRCSSASPSTSPSAPASWQRSPTTCRRRSPACACAPRWSTTRACARASSPTSTPCRAW